MPLEDEIIPDEKQGSNREHGLQNFLDSAQNVLAEAVAKSAAEKAVENMFSSGQHANRGGAQHPGGPSQEGIYPDLDKGNNQKDSNFMDTAQNAFADAFAKRAAEKLVDGILPSSNTQPDSNYGPPPPNVRPQERDHSGFDLGRLGSSLLESLSDQVLHPSDKQNHQQPRYNQQQDSGKEQSGFDIGNVGSELLSSLAQQLHSNKTQQEHQPPTSGRRPHEEGDNQSGFDIGKVGSELLGSLAEQVLHPSDKKVTEHPQVPQNQDNNQSGFDIGKVGAELLGTLAEQVLHPSDKKEEAAVQNQSANNHGNISNQPKGGDITSILGSLAENVLGGTRHNEDHQVGDERKDERPSAKPHSLADSAGDIATSVLGSLAESVLHKNSNNEPQQYQGPNNYGPFPQGPGPQWYPPGPQGYGPGPQGYGPGPQGYGPGPEGYGPGPQGYGPGPQGYGPGPQGYGPGPQGYWPGPQGYGPPPQTYRPPHQGYRPESQKEPNSAEDHSSDIGAALLNTVASAVRHSPASHQDHQKKQQPEEEDSPAAELGSFLVNSLASKMLQPHHNQ